jgi:hypothetical protein
VLVAVLMVVPLMPVVVVMLMVVIMVVVVAFVFRAVQRGFYRGLRIVFEGVGRTQ